MTTKIAKKNKKMQRTKLEYTIVLITLLLLSAVLMAVLIAPKIFPSILCL